MVSFRRLCPKCLTEKTPSPRAYAVLILIILGSMTFLYQTVTDLMQARLFRCYNQGISSPQFQAFLLIFWVSGGNILTPLDESQVPKGTSFFFHETSCAIDDITKDIRLNARQACAVESTALHHPNNSKQCQRDGVFKLMSGFQVFIYSLLRLCLLISTQRTTKLYRVCFNTQISKFDTSIYLSKLLVRVLICSKSAKYFVS